MSWNYRIIRRHNGTRVDPAGNEEIYGYSIHEVYYDENGNPHSCTKDAVDPYGDSPEEVVETLEMMLRDAKRQSVLNYEDF